MNLKDITDEVNSALDYNPDLAAYKDQVSRVVNRHYLQISSQYNWLFRQKTSKLTLRKDISSKTTTADDGTTTSMNVLNVGNDLILDTDPEGSTSSSFDASNVARFVGTSDTLPTPEMLGNTLVISDNNTFTTLDGMSHGASEREFTITGIFDLDEIRGKYGSLGRYGGTGGEEWPDGYQPGDYSGIVLDRPIIDPSEASAEARTKNVFYNDWKIEFRQYYLPADCIEVLGISDRGDKLPVHTETSRTIATTVNTAPNRGRIIFIDSSKEEFLDLDRDSAGDPVVAIEGMPVSLSAPMVPPIITEINARDTNSDKQSRKLASLVGGDTYEYCYTFVYAGIESPPSPITRFRLPTTSDFWNVAIGTESVEGDFRRDGTFGATDTDINQRGSDEEATKNVDQTKRMTGRIKRFYRRRVMQNTDLTQKNIVNARASKLDSTDVKPITQWQGYQRWLHIGDHFTDGIILDIGMKQEEFADAGGDRVDFKDEISEFTPVLGFPQSHFLEFGYWTYHDGELSKVKVLDESGPRQTLKVYRPPSQDMDIRIRYLSRPKRLVADGDTPEWPVQYHHLLVYMTLADICLQHGMNNQSQLYERKSIELLDRMKQKYLSRTNRKYIRRGFDRTLFQGERFGVPTKA